MAVKKSVPPKPSRLAKRHDWAIIGLRILFLLGAALAIFIVRSQAEEPAGDYTDLAIAAGVGFGVTVVLAVSVLVKSLKPVVPFVLMGGDAMLVGAFVYVGDGDPMVLIGAAGFLSVTGMLWLDDMLGALQAILVNAIALGAALYLQISQSSDQLDSLRHNGRPLQSRAGDYSADSSPSAGASAATRAAWTLATGRL